MKTKFLILISTLFFCLSFTNEENAKIYGLWLSPEKTSKLKIYKATDGKVYGKIAWMNKPNDTDGLPRKDKNNPDESKRSTLLQDLVILRGFVYKGNNLWEDGTIYDPQNGKTYSCTMTLVNDNTLNLRGYVGFSMLGRTAVFTKSN
jgi:uncharacterized protein (DUF2147 family)